MSAVPGAPARMQGRQRIAKPPMYSQGMPAAALTLHCSDPATLACWSGVYGSHSSAPVMVE